MSPVVDATSERGRDEAIQQAADAVRAGEVIVLPTDTVYGVGCDAFNPGAVESLLEAKGRGRDMPPPVLVPSPRTVDGLATDVPGYARDLIRTFWPGPLTLIFVAQPSLQWDLGETNGTVALRMPHDDICVAVLSEVGPMAVTSANRTGHPPAHTVTEAATQLGPAVSIYLDGGERRDVAPSTIVDCTGDRPVVLREGAITPEQIAEIAAPHLEANTGLEDDTDGTTEALTPDDEAALNAQLAADEASLESPHGQFFTGDDATELDAPLSRFSTDFDDDEPETTELPVVRRQPDNTDN
ncbi:L-threonylcarbamoyladenylate synthase [Kribbia dieselivorans]|uniref:L-threonylcarbamoyladenylate synthase n=1 Tax=Kribbia dieselivorans TaxID=331526 RepID=UPI0009FA93EF|nr:L-threonylcarbamoyladenylate synthase [Kribbia dieselivorans]